MRTRDIEFDISFLIKSPKKVDIPRLLRPLDFEIEFKGEGYITLSHPQIIIEFLFSERGKGGSELYKIPGFGIVAQPMRFLFFLEEEPLTVSYQDLKIKVPHPIRFAIHKMIVSQRRPSQRADKAEKDLQQAVAVLDMLIRMGQDKAIKEVISHLPKGWRKILKQALSEAKEKQFAVLIDRIENLFPERFER